MYASWYWFIGLFLRRRCVVVLRSGQEIVWLRPKNQTAEEYRKEFLSWAVAAHNRITLITKQGQCVIMSDDVLAISIR